MLDCGRCCGSCGDGTVRTADRGDGGHRRDGHNVPVRYCAMVRGHRAGTMGGLLVCSRLAPTKFAGIFLRLEDHAKEGAQ